MNPITIRDPLWDTIHVDPVARRIIDTAAFQRLRYIRQLGHAHLVYPGATHTRFDHAVGVYHLARRALQVLGERGDLDQVDEMDCRVLPLAALLHDIGHYPFSHALEELEPDRIPGHHESLTGQFLREGELAAVLADVAPDAGQRIEALIRGQSGSPLQGLVSGSLDLDKIEYLKRDARFCGVPYGEVDVDRLLHSLTLLRDPESGRLEIGVREKGVAALESLLFAKYQMFRNVYWHHAVRAATVLYKRVVADALDAGLVAGDELVGETDEGLMHLLMARSAAGDDAPPTVPAGVAALRSRRLPKRAAEVSAGELADETVAGWLSTDSRLKRRMEEQLAAELGAAGGSVYVDFPDKPAMFGLDLLLRRHSGDVIRLGPAGYAGLIGLPGIADELYRSARILRVYVAGERWHVPEAAVERLASLGAEAVTRRMDAGTALLDGASA
ncbi:MAG TPA: HD domain-containing protein [Longimicrobiales bacterium]|nr:HD domain-containing protein [Longimicrobiales bacterium]